MHRRRPHAVPERGARWLPVRRARTGRPGGKRFGTLVHAALAIVDMSANESEVRKAAAAQGRLIGASSCEIEAASVAVTAALEHPLMKRAAASASAGGLRRETPVVLRLADATLAEGVVDLAFREQRNHDATWTVIDFKTDQELGPQRARYEEQVRLYVAAVTAATGEPARGVLLVV